MCIFPWLRRIKVTRRCCGRTSICVCTDNGLVHSLAWRLQSTDIQCVVQLQCNAV